MKQFELLAIMPATTRTPTNPALHLIDAHGYTAILLPKSRPSILLPKSRKQGLSDAAIRQAHLESCMSSGPLVVCRPDCVLTEGDISGLVNANRQLLDDLTARLAGKVQYQITVSWAPEGVLTQFRESDELAPIFQAPRVAADVLQHAVQTLADRLKNDIAGSLEIAAKDVLHLPTEDDMLVNAVVLVNTDEVALLDNAVEQIDAIWTEGFRIRQIGPAPAGSFVLLDPQIVGKEEIAAAHRHLKLDEPSTYSQIEEARKGALRVAPERAEYTNHCARIAIATLSARDDAPPLFLCHVRSEEMAATRPERQVA
ncbi:MAG: GvpL/GvpF family gas vesicle protein [Pseudomonadota bacterium]